MEKARNAVVQEARELLIGVEPILGQVATGDAGDAGDTVNEIFRAVHTIKGSAALLGFERLVGFTNLLENVLGHVRDKQSGLPDALRALLVECFDYIADLVDAVAAHKEDVEPDIGRRERLSQALQAVLDAPRYWRIELCFNEDLLRSGMDPTEFLRLLHSLGTVHDVHTRVDSIPPAAVMDPESCYLSFSILLAASCQREDIDGIFEFVREGSEISVHEVDVLDDALDGGFSGPQTVLAHSTHSPSQPAKGHTTGHTTSPLVRVPVERLDALVDLLGDLVITGASAAQLASRHGDTALRDAMGTLERLIGQMREATLGLRMLPINEVFESLPRLVRSVARDSAKEVTLTMTGGDTELDKSLLEKISDPLMHIVRNAIDHGIEPPHERTAAGKPPVGSLQLSAYQQSGSVVIEVKDDGRGLDYEAIARKAVLRGLVQPDQTLTNEELGRLLLEPGFSTREQAGRHSGRGVGMDIVRERVEALRGEVEVLSRRGHGTTVRLRLPLTLAIIDGFLVTVGESSFVIPLELMVECVDARQHHMFDGAVTLRGETMPCLRLREVFGLPPLTEGRESLVVVQYGNSQRAGLFVDGLQGEVQAVVKPLGMLFNKVGGLSGSTVLGDGRLALILDVPQLIHRAASRYAGQGAPAAAAQENHGHD